MKVFEIHGKLSIADDSSHQDMIYILFEELKKQGVHFAGTTKDITNEIK
jgi:hypothetical protein